MQTCVEDTLTDDILLKRFASGDKVRSMVDGDESVVGLLKRFASGDKVRSMVDGDESVVG